MVRQMSRWRAAGGNAGGHGIDDATAGRITDMK
jgi:hypothetical protein